MENLVPSIPPAVPPAPGPVNLDEVLDIGLGTSRELAIPDDYRVQLPSFEGPLDLLLHLIRKEQVNIYDIPVAEICERYLSYLSLMCAPDVNVAGEFFVMAATLVHLKSQILLPKDEVAEDEDPRLPLVAQLLELERFKQVAVDLDARSWLDRDLYARPPTSAQDTLPVESLLDAPIEPVDTFQLLLCLKSATDRTTRPSMEIQVDATSLQEKVGTVSALLDGREIFDFTELLPQAYRVSDIIVSFLAILELAKLRFVEVLQYETFGPIQVRGVRPMSELNTALLDQF